MKLTVRNTTVERIHLDRQGYDKRGHYWGVGAKLYRLWPVTGTFVSRLHMRAAWLDYRAPTARQARLFAVRDGYTYSA